MPAKKTKKTAKPAKPAKKAAKIPAAKTKKAAPAKAKKTTKPAVKPVVKKENKEALTAAEIKEIKQHLMQLREEAILRLKDKKDMDMPEAEVGDDIDTATRSLDKEILFELSGNAHNTIEQIESALRRIEKGIYGTCESCRQPIPKKRIKALPFARYCINCQHTSERRRD